MIRPSFSLHAVLASLLLVPALAWAAPAQEYTAPERQALRDIAHNAILAALDGQEFQLPQNLPPKLLKPRGAFVTLKKNNRLRGCIGSVVSNLPLAETVAEMARAAALEDPRFAPLTPPELKDLSLEISVLTTPEPVTSIGDITVGVHGLILRNGLHAGLLLPQVPTEYGWNKLTFLEETCGKAGLKPDCWKDPDTRIEAFSAEVF